MYTYVHQVYAAALGCQKIVVSQYSGAGKNLGSLQEQKVLINTEPNSSNPTESQSPPPFYIACAMSSAYSTLQS